jgi:hypothetical protein
MAGQFARSIANNHLECGGEIIDKASLYSGRYTLKVLSATILPLSSSVIRQLPTLLLTGAQMQSPK